MLDHKHTVFALMNQVGMKLEPVLVKWIIKKELDSMVILKMENILLDKIVRELDKLPLDVIGNN
jgi:hypothetical protein